MSVDWAAAKAGMSTAVAAVMMLQNSWRSGELLWKGGKRAGNSTKSGSSASTLDVARIGGWRGKNTAGGLWQVGRQPGPAG